MEYLARVDTLGSYGSDDLFERTATTAVRKEKVVRRRPFLTRKLRQLAWKVIRWTA